MKMIILAAGEGSRLRPLTNNKPKCMVEYNNKPIIHYILETATTLDIKDIAIVNGYKKEILEEYLKNQNITFYTNKMYASTNMLSTLFHAKEFMNDDIIISYADIVYKKEVLQKIISSKSNFSVVIDKDWKKLWSIRMENPLEDAETLKINNKKIVEIGNKPKNYNEIEGQYIGLIKISKNIIPQVIEFYNNLDKKKIYDGQNFDNMYMTTFIQLVIDKLLDVSPVLINGGWIEIDTLEDIESYQRANLII